MIKVQVVKNNDIIESISVTGHSGYSEAGSDIVCASVSSICITTVNAIVRLDNNAIEYKEADGMLKVEVNSHSEVIDTLIFNMVELLSELANDYKNYIKIIK
ncbi:MAG: ribosomal-processing cysteine protease Prp [Firmicutes bacterium]|nr:ribosomal-processing cysteine protease Prp [Bacillota bacterium]